MSQMTFPEYRELLVHINRTHSPNKNHTKPVWSIECVTDMRSGRVTLIRMHGSKWVKTFINPTTEACHQFLSQDGGEDPKDNQRTQSALDAIMRVLLGEFGREMVNNADQFGGGDLTFTIKSDILKAAIKEYDDDLVGREASRKGDDTGKRVRGSGKTDRA